MKDILFLQVPHTWKFKLDYFFFISSLVGISDQMLFMH